MARTRTVDHDAVLDRWAAGMRRSDIAAVLGLSPETVKTVLRLARLEDDGRAASRRVQVDPPAPIDPFAPLHVRLGIKPETRFVPTLDPSPNHLRVPVTVSSLRGGPVVYGRSVFRGRIGAVRAAVGRAVMMHTQAAE